MALFLVHGPLRELFASRRKRNSNQLLAEVLNLTCILKFHFLKLFSSLLTPFLSLLSRGLHKNGFEGSTATSDQLKMNRQVKLINSRRFK